MMMMINHITILIVNQSIRFHVVPLQNLYLDLLQTQTRWKKTALSNQ